MRNPEFEHTGNLVTVYHAHKTVPLICLALVVAFFLAMFAVLVTLSPRTHTPAGQHAEVPV